MPTYDGIVYDSSFGGVPFAAGKAQGLTLDTQYADQTIAGGAVTGTSYTYRDWYATPPDVLELELLLPDRATLDDLAALRGYPADNGGVPYDLVLPQFSWTATLDKLTTAAAWMDVAIVAHATFTKVADLVAPAASPAAPTAGYVWGASGLDAALDLNQGSASPDGLLDSYDVEWGDTATSNVDSGGTPWDLSLAAVPIATHTYALAGDYVVTVSVVRNGVRSDDYAAVVTVAG